MTNYQDENYALYPKSGAGCWAQGDSGVVDGKDWEDRYIWVETPNGFVRASAHLFGHSYAFSRLQIIKNGRIYYREFKKVYSNQYLVTLAKRFSRELFND